MPRIHINIGPPDLLNLFRILLGLCYGGLFLDLAVVSGHHLSLSLLLILRRLLLLLHFDPGLLYVLLVRLVLLGHWLFDCALDHLLLRLEWGSLGNRLLLLLRWTLLLLDWPDHVLCPTQRCILLLLILHGQNGSWSLRSFSIIIRYNQVLNLLVHRLLFRSEVSRIHLLS